MGRIQIIKIRDGRRIAIVPWRDVVIIHVVMGDGRRLVWIRLGGIEYRSGVVAQPVRDGVERCRRRR